VSSEKLTESSCTACREDAPLVTKEEIEELKPQIPAWQIQKIDGIDRLICAFSFDDYMAGLKFVSKVANLAEEEDHHPEIILEWGKVTVSWWSHKIKGLHKNDFIAAAKTDCLFVE
tara:strand:- start:29 stop:376 length:348 start_codon:yes stop_codon:yes gene_type:complete